MFVRKDGIEIASFAIDAFAHRPFKGYFRPATDAGDAIWRDIGAVDRAKRCRDRHAAGVRRTTRHCVATRAATDSRQLGASLDRCLFEWLQVCALDRIDRRRPSEWDAVSACNRDVQHDQSTA